MNCKDTELHRLVFLATGSLNLLEKAISQLQNGFLNNDYAEAEKTLERLKGELTVLNVGTRVLFNTEAERRRADYVRRKL